MNAKADIEERLPSRHVTEASARVVHRLHGGTSGLIGGAVDVFKKTPCIPGLKLSGRDVAKDLIQVGGIPLPMTVLLGHGVLLGNGITFTGRATAENLKPVTTKPNQNVVRPAATHQVSHAGA